MKILMLSNQSRSMSVFWRVLIQKARSAHCEIVCCVPPGDAHSEQALNQAGARVIHYNLDRKGINPIADIRTWLELKKIFKKEKPDLLFATTIKPVIYGCFAASACGIKSIYATITGLGYAFEADTFLKKAINRVSRMLYRASLSRAQGIFFQNPDDRQIFLEQGILHKNAPILSARGTGVDTRHFAQAPLPDTGPGRPTVFLLVCRLLEAKGLREYAEAARILKSVYPQTVFQILGPPETGPGSVTLEEVKSWFPDVVYLGQTDDVRDYIARSHVMVLPSWREGLPTALMEGMSIGRACIASNVPGCRHVIREGENGFLAKAKNPESLARTMRKFLDNPALMAIMGNAARKMAENEFDALKVADGILRDMGVEVS